MNALIINRFVFFVQIIMWSYISLNHEIYKVEIFVNENSFQAPAEIPSGWISFVLNNEKTQEIHEISIARIPDGITFSEYIDEYISVWELILAEYQSGDIERHEISAKVNNLLPSWVDDLKYVNTRGLVSPGRSAQKTMYLDPGLYIMECWVKSEDGLIHITNGKIHPFTVTDEKIFSSAPSTVNLITLKKNEIAVQWKAESGFHSFALTMDTDSEGNPFHNNIHLIRIDDMTDLISVNWWMDWYQIGGLRAPAPADFLGGVSSYIAIENEIDAYFSLTIDQPGKYAWIVQAPDGKHLWKTFHVP